VNDRHPLQDVAITAAEQWRPIRGYEGLYQVSDRGNLLSRHSGEWKVKKAAPNPDGYFMVQLHKDQKHKLIGVHRLVAIAFLGEPPEGKPEAAHLDGNNKNNRADNLIWASRKENLQHRVIHGTILKGETHPRAKLSSEQVCEIWSSRLPARAIAAAMGVSWHTVNDIRHGLRWTHITAGLEPQPRRSTVQNKKPMTAAIIDGFRRGLSNSQIAAENDISRNLAWKMRTEFAAVAKPFAQKEPS